ncbi:MAG TPA: FtsX-like permease family protein [Thermoplasmata archaeon]|nr:FtsX-like permease family protein [Thermoplasmata archaeon]
MRYSLDAIRRRPGRSAMTVLGIGLAVGLVVLLLALSAGVQASATTLATESGVDLIGASANTSLLGGGFPPVSHAHELATEIPAVDSNVAVASPWLTGEPLFANASLWSAANRSSVPSGWGPTSSGIVGWIPGDNTGIQVPTIYNGTGFTSPQDPHYANGTYSGPFTHEIVLDQSLAAALGVGVGGRVWASPVAPSSSAALQGWFAHAIGFEVVGVSGPFWLLPSAFLAFGYLSEVQTLLGGATPSTDYATLLLIHLNDPTTASADQLRIESAFRFLTVFTLSEILGEIQHVVDLYRTFGTLIGAIGLVVAALFTTTILLMSVDDRSRELALLRALGHPRATVGAYVVEEGLLLGALGLAVGLPIAYVGANAINRFLLSELAGLPTSFSFVSFDPGVILTGVLVVVAVGLVASIAPAARAMQLPVAEELRAP